MATPTIRERIHGCIIGLAVGDALGVPVETMTHEQIMAITNRLGITEYIPPQQTRTRGAEGLPRGAYSDDTQLTLVTLRSLVARGGFDLRDQAMELVAEYERSTFGWGGTTRAAAFELMTWRDSGGTEGRMPEVPARESLDPKKRGCGSGVAMRIAPLALWHLCNERVDSATRNWQFSDDAIALGMLTHADPRASIAAIALGHTIGHFSSDVVATTARVARAVRDAEVACTHFRPKQPRFSEVLQKALTYYSDPERLRHNINTGFSALESVPFAIVTALRHTNDFRAGVLEGVNAGRDTDTVGSMVGAILGARVGIQGIPKEWIDGLDGAAMISECANALADRILNF